MNPHGQRAHALLGPSGAERWMNCPPSARLADDQDDETSAYAEEGTAAHELAEFRLKEAFGLPVEADRLAAIQAGPYYSAEMEDHVQRYVDLVQEKYNEAVAVAGSAKLMVEAKLDLRRWIPESFGTGDAVIIAPDVRVIVIDLKYGKGKPVSAHDNPQLKQYGLGALGAFEPIYDFDEVEVVIAQPRLNSFTDWKTPVQDLLTWADTEVRPKAELAWAGAGEFNPGSWCYFCRVKPQCRAYAERQLELTRYELRQAQLLSLEEIADILDRVDELVSWASAVKEFAQVQAEKNGLKVPGHKLVEGRSSRAYVDEDIVHNKLVKEGFTEDAIAPRKLIGITAMEKLLGGKVFKALLGALVVKPPGKPVLVKESDPRPEINSAARDFEALE